MYNLNNLFQETIEKEKRNLINATSIVSGSQQSDTKETTKQRSILNTPTSSIVTRSKVKANLEQRITQIQETIPQLDKTEDITQKENMIDASKIQQEMANCIPLFNGGDSTTVQSQLARFLASADVVYNNLKNDEEKRYFDQTIVLRLDGEAFTRVNRRNIPDYKTLKEVLNDMYAQIISLNELERKLLSIKQNYGESIRNFGIRLSEALEQYQMGYKQKYKLEEMDAAYIKHLTLNAVITFKKGLNNTIIKEKVATSSHETINQLVNEAESIERILDITTSTDSPHIPEIHLNRTNNNLSRNLQRSQIICNYCNKPNHTWNVCRTRMMAELTQQQSYRNQNYQGNQNYNHRQQYNHRQSYSNQQPYNNRQPRPTQNTVDLQRTYNEYRNPTNGQQFNKYNHNQNFNKFQNQNAQYSQNNRTQYQPKYCSHCKNTTGHTYDECRNKFLGPRNYNTNEYGTPRQQPDTSRLEEKFNNMKIQTLNNYQTEQIQHEQNQGNSLGSDNM